MASVNGYTAEYVADIEARTVTSAFITSGGALVLETEDGTQINAGPITSGMVTPTPAITTVAAYDMAANDVVIPEWNDGTPNEQLTVPLNLTYSGQGVSWSPDGRYLLVGFAASPYVYLFKRDGDKLVKLTDPTGVTFWPTAIVWSPDGRYVAFGSAAGSFLQIYKRTGDTLALLTAPANMPNGNVYDIVWSPDGRFMFISHFNSSFTTNFIAYQRAGDVFTKITDPPVPTSGNVATAMSVSPGGRFIFLAATGTMSNWWMGTLQGGTITKISDPASGPPATVYGAGFSPDGNYLFLGATSAPYVAIYKRSGSTWTKLATPTDLPPVGIDNTHNSVSWSPDGRYVAFALSSYPSIYVYKRSGDTFTKVVDPAELPGISGAGVISWDPLGQYLVVTQDDLPYWTIYKSSMKSVDAPIPIDIQA